jgi:hypothetical protein
MGRAEASGKQQRRVGEGGFNSFCLWIRSNKKVIHQFLHKPNYANFRAMYMQYWFLHNAALHLQAVIKNKNVPVI